MKAAETRFSPEFRNRIDEIIVFAPLTMDEVRQIAETLSGQVAATNGTPGQRRSSVTEAALNLLTEKGYNTAYGARFLKRHIDEKVKLPITAHVEDGLEFRGRCGRRRDGCKTRGRDQCKFELKYQRLR